MVEERGHVADMIEDELECGGAEREHLCAVERDNIEDEESSGRQRVRVEAVMLVQSQADSENDRIKDE